MIDPEKKNGAHLFDGVFEILIQRGINPGFATRISMCNKVCKKRLEMHQYYWKHVAKEKFGWKKEKDNYTILNMFVNNRKCRECGNKKCYPVKTSLDNYVWLCLGCTEEEGGYNQLCTRLMIFGEKQVWSNKRRIVNYLTLAKKGINRKHMYWIYEVKKYRIKSILKNRRILPF